MSVAPFTTQHYDKLVSEISELKSIVKVINDRTLYLQETMILLAEKLLDKKPIPPQPDRFEHNILTPSATPASARISPASYNPFDASFTQIVSSPLSATPTNLVPLYSSVAPAPASAPIHTSPPNSINASTFALTAALSSPTVQQNQSDFGMDFDAFFSPAKSAKPEVSTTVSKPAQGNQASTLELAQSFRKEALLGIDEPTEEDVSEFDELFDLHDESTSTYLEADEEDEASFEDEPCATTPIDDDADLVTLSEPGERYKPQKQPSSIPTVPLHPSAQKLLTMLKKLCTLIENPTALNNFYLHSFSGFLKSDLNARQVLASLSSYILQQELKNDEQNRLVGLTARGCLYLNSLKDESNAKQDLMAVIQAQHKFQWKNKKIFFLFGLAHFKLGFIHMGTSGSRTNESEDVEMKEYAECIKVMPQFTPAYINRGKKYQFVYKNYIKAREDFTAAVLFDPMCSMAYYARGLLLQKHFQDYFLAVADYSKFIDVTQAEKKKREKQKVPESNAHRMLEEEVYFNRGFIYQKFLHNSYQSIQDYTYLLHKLNPKNSVAYNNRGLVFENEKDYKKAMKDYERALQLDSKYSQAAKNLERVKKLV